MAFCVSSLVLNSQPPFSPLRETKGCGDVRTRREIRESPEVRGTGLRLFERRLGGSKMAASGPGSLLRPVDLAEELTCPVCLELFQEPVMLRCGHHYCRGCIEQVWGAPGGPPQGPAPQGPPQAAPHSQGPFFCPECRAQFADGAQFTSSRLLSNLVQKARALTLEGGDGGPQGGPAAQLCPEHDEKLKLFCLEHQLPVCLVCRDAPRHQGHGFLPVDDARGLYMERLDRSMRELESKLQEIKKWQSLQENEMSSTKGKALSLEQHIRSEFSELHLFLVEREERLIEELKDEEEAILAVMEANLARIKERRSVQETFLNFHARLRQQDPVTFLTGMKWLSDRDPKEKQKEEDCKATVVSRELSWGRFKGPIQYTAWKEMKSILNPGHFCLTMDPCTAHPNLVLSDDLTRVRHSDLRQQLPDLPQRFGHFIIAMGAQGFTSGRHYWEVKVENKSEWYVGVAKESVNRQGNKNASPDDGYWAIYLRNGVELKALDATPRPLFLPTRPLVIGVYLDYEGGQVSFYDAKDMAHIYTFSAVFTEKLFPYFSPGYNDSGRNARELQLLHHPSF